MPVLLRTYNFWALQTSFRLELNGINVWVCICALSVFSFETIRWGVCICWLRFSYACLPHNFIVFRVRPRQTAFGRKHIPPSSTVYANETACARVRWDHPKSFHCTAYTCFRSAHDSCYNWIGITAVPFPVVLWPHELASVAPRASHWAAENNRLSANDSNYRNPKIPEIWLLSQQSNCTWAREFSAPEKHWIRCINGTPLSFFSWQSIVSLANGVHGTTQCRHDDFCWCACVRESVPLCMCTVSYAESAALVPFTICVAHRWLSGRIGIGARFQTNVRMCSALFGVTHRTGVFSGWFHLFRLPIVSNI